MAEPQNPPARPGVPPGRRAAALGALVGVLALSGWGGSRVVAAAQESSSSCSNPATVQVAAPAAIADAVDHAAQAAVDSGKACAYFNVTPTDPGETYKSIISSSSDQPQVWISDSPAWTTLIERKLGDGWVTVGDTIATSPVVLGVPKVRASQQDSVKGKNWAELLDTNKPVSLLDANQSTASFMHLVAANQQATTKDEQNTLMQDILQDSRDLTTPDGTLDKVVKSNSTTKMFPISEQQLVTFNRAHPAQAMTSIVPKGGAEQLQYQWVTPVRGTGAPQQALQALKTQLLSPAEVTYRAQHGFRDASGKPLGQGGLPVNLPMMPAATPQQTIGAKTAWEDLKKDARMLVLVDVSGSMQTPVGGGKTRIQVLEDTAIAALDALPQTTRMGAWAFSSNLQKNDVDYLPLTKGEQPLLDQSYKNGIVQQAKKLPELASKNGDTALYDSIAAAYKSVNDTYDPNYINSVVVLTDGRNDDPNGGLNLQQLLSKLKSEYDVDKPVKIVTIAIGDDTDPAALKQITQATDGLSYTTTSANQIASVFVNAFLHRTDY